MAYAKRDTIPKYRAKELEFNVSRGKKLMVGSCNMCVDRDSYEEINIVEMRSLSFRLCDKCKKQLKEAPSTEVSWPSKVYESEKIFTLNGDTPIKNNDNLKSSWQAKSIVFNNEHLIDFLSNIRAYFQESKKSR